jgi:hypothetical protein
LGIMSTSLIRTISPELRSKAGIWW